MVEGCGNINELLLRGRKRAPKKDTKRLKKSRKKVLTKEDGCGKIENSRLREKAADEP